MQRLLTVLLRHRYMILLSGLALGLTAGVVALLKDRTYTTEFSFLPESVDSRGPGISAIAGQLGIQVPRADATTSPQFYTELLQSRVILRQLLTDTFHVATMEENTPGDGTLASLIGIEQSDPERRRSATISWLRRAVIARVSREAGIVRVTVKTPEPQLSHAISVRLLELLNQFNLQSRQSRASGERRFIEARLAEVERELSTSEAELESFLTRHRQIENSPHLKFQLERLERRVLLDQQRVIALRDALYEAQIAELRDTPVISVVEQPEVPPIADSRGVIRNAILGILFGCIIAAFFGLAKDGLRRRAAEGSDDARNLATAWRDTVNDFRRLAPHR